ncbi:MAG: DUF5977 domain-containing protein [Chitinophagaceae bacterium]|nr:DUF5977 domain-containing protein [Chitinophagaceae bacterium]
MKKVLAFLLLISFEKIVFCQVSPQTGSASITIPVFNWQDDKSRLNSAIALSYNSGNGLKVNEVASNIGQGWSMSGGGVVTRMQIGEPDDQKPREGSGLDDLTKYPAGYLYNSVNPSAGCPTALTKYPIYEDKNHLYKQHNLLAADRELDRFAFQFNGRSGMFVLDKNNGDVGVSLGDNTLKIWFSRNESTMAAYGCRTTISEFNIQDENGLIYKFNLIEKTKILKFGYCDSRFTTIRTQPKFEGGKVYYEAGFDPDYLSNPYFDQVVNPYIVNSWYLSEILDPLTQRKINFNYVTRNINTASGSNITHYDEKDYSVISHATSITQTPELSTITFPDGHYVGFNYGNPRIDLNGGYALASIDVKYQERYLSRYQLATSYFILNRFGTPVSNAQKKNARLCLLSVKKIGVDMKDEEEPYYFDYYTGSNAPDDFVPPPFFYARDNWGYYNGDNSKSATNTAINLFTPLNELNNTQLKGLCFLRDGNTNAVLTAKPGYAKNGLLKQVIYPTGGTLKYEYAQNEAILNSTNTTVGGVHVSKTIVTDGGYSNDCNNQIITNYTYGSDESNTQSSLWGVEMPVHSMVMNSYYEPEYKYFYYKPPFSFGCDYRYQYPGILSREQAISLTTMQQFLQVVTQVLDVVGGVMTIVDIVSLTLKATPAAWIAVIVDIIGSLVTIIISCTTDRSKSETTTLCYNSDLKSSNPLPTQFKRVEVTESSGGNGKTIMEFTSPDDYPIWEPTNPAFSMKQRFAFWAYGLPKKTTVKDAAGNIIRQSENGYYFTNAKRGFEPHPGLLGYPSCKCLVTRSSSVRNTTWENPDYYNAPYSSINQSNSEMLVDIYDVYSGRVELIESYERVFKSGTSSQYLETNTSFGYNNNNFQVNKVTTTQSNGDINIKAIKYSNDYTTGIFTTLNQNNIVGLPVSTTTAVIKSGGSYVSQYMSEIVTEYTSLTTGDIKPYRTLERRFSQPQLLSNFYQGPGHPSNPADYKEIQNLSYDVAGNLTGMKDEGSRTVSNIYDYNDKYVVASVINAEPVLDKIAYTSFETQSMGGWTLGGTAGYSSSSSVTGKRSLVLSASNSLSTNLNTAKPYRLSFWATNSGVTVAGNATLTKSAPAINGFTYYEYSIAQGTATVSLSGTATIDELRINPQTARMRTITFDPLIGKTSECDENNRITYYEYDALGRLQLVKDDYKNIIKMYEYNTAANMQTSCPATYYNKTVTEVFTKDDCGTGFIGSNVTYTVPANKYSSTISQAAVDLLVEDELNNYGQAYANANGTCIQVYYNTVQTGTFTKQGCPLGMKGIAVVYNVPANKYSSIISQADANQMALDEIEANGQALANVPTMDYCTNDTTSVWRGTGQVQCNVNSSGVFTGEQLVEVISINPNSPTYNQKMWINTGPNTAECTNPPMTNLTYTNTTSTYVYVQLKNVATNYMYNFTLPSGVSTSTVAGQIPVGPYDVTMTSSDGLPHYYRIYNYIQTGVTTFNASNVPLCSVCASITVQ